MMGLTMINLRVKFYRTVCINCESTQCERDKETMVGCATLIVWNKLEEKA